MGGPPTAPRIARKNLHGGGGRPRCHLAPSLPAVAGLTSLKSSTSLRRSPASVRISPFRSASRAGQTSISRARRGSTSPPSESESESPSRSVPVFQGNSRQFRFPPPPSAAATPKFVSLGRGGFQTGRVACEGKVVVVWIVSDVAYAALSLGCRGSSEVSRRSALGEVDRPAQRPVATGVPGAVAVASGTASARVLLVG